MRHRAGQTWLWNLFGKEPFLLLTFVETSYEDTWIGLNLLTAEHELVTPEEGVGEWELLGDV